MTSEDFNPASRLEQLTSTLTTVFGRHFSIIAIAVAVIGVILVAAGPGRMLFASPSDGADLPGSQPEETAGSDSPDGAPLAAIPITDGFADGSAAIDRAIDPVTDEMQGPPNRVFTYTVQKGDTITEIASRFGLDRSTIFWANTEKLNGDVHMLGVGMNLFILPIDGVYHKSDGNKTIQQIADEYFVNVNDILTSPYNEIAGMTASSVPPWGARIVIPGGTGASADWRSPLEPIDFNGRIVYAFMPNQPGSCGSVPGGRGTGTWINPVTGWYIITSVFDGFHGGYDLAGRTGTPVYASDSGTVIFSGWTIDRWGYGKLVVIDHGGWTSYYAHLDAINVVCGQGVFQGNMVGTMGNTGRSTGPHLHFETRFNHIPQDPSQFIGF